jgi:hypothetical protein
MKPALSQTSLAVRSSGDTFNTPAVSSTASVHQRNAVPRPGSSLVNDRLGEIRALSTCSTTTLDGPTLRYGPFYVDSKFRRALPDPRLCRSYTQKPSPWTGVLRKFREAASCCGQQRPRRNSHSPCSSSSPVAPIEWQPRTRAEALEDRSYLLGRVNGDDPHDLVISSSYPCATLLLLIPGAALRRLAGQFMKVFLSHSTKTGAFVIGTTITNQPDDLGGGPVGFLSIN